MSEIFLRVAFLLALSFVGWVVGKTLKVNATDISSLLIYVISPFVIFVSIVQSPAEIVYIRYSLAALLFSSFASILAFFFGKWLWPNSKKANLFGFSGGTGNTGYFALPIAFSLFNEHQIAVAIFVIIGVNIYEFSIGYFMAAKGKMNTKDSLLKVIRLPILYSAIAGLIMKSLEIPLGSVLESGLNNFKGAYSVLGMMIIGITLSTFSGFRMDIKFTTITLLWKHVALPAVGILLIYGLTSISQQDLVVIALMLSTPMAANVVIISNNLEVHPEIAASTVLLSTVLSLISVPIVMTILG